MTSGYQFAISNIVQEGDSGGAISAVKDNETYVVGVVNAENDSPIDGKTIGGYGTAINLSEYYSAFNKTGLRENITHVNIFAKDNGDYIDGTGGNLTVVDSGNNSVITAGSDDIVNTEVGKDDVVFLPSALGQSDSGTTVVVSPGITTLVGGGANDKLVLLADRLGGDGDQQSNTNTLSDSSDTIQLLGGFDIAGSTSPDYKGYYASGGMQEIYFMHGADLEISYRGSGWSGELVIKNYHDGDFGLSFPGKDDADAEHSGKISDDQLGRAEQAGFIALTPQAQTSNQIDDDPSVSWQGIFASPWGGDGPEFVSPTISDATIAADLKSVMSGDGNGFTDPSPDPAAPTAPSIADTTANHNIVAEATVSPFAGMTITDTNSGADDTVTIMQLGGKGTLTGAGLTANADGTYTLTGADPTTITAELQALTFSPSATAAGEQSTTLFTLIDRSSAGTSATDVTTAVTDTAEGTPTTSIQITGGGAPLAAGGATLTPFSDVTVGDDNLGAADTVTIAISGAAGTLSGEGLVVNPDGTYTIASSGPSDITTQLRALTFMPTSGSTPGLASAPVFTLSVVNSAGARATKTVTSVFAVTIDGAQSGQTTTDEAPTTPFAGVALKDGNSGATDTVTITLSGGAGALSGDGLTENPDGTYTFTADAATASEKFQAITFSSALPTDGVQSTTNFTIEDQSSAGPSAYDFSTSVTDNSTAVFIRGTSSAQTTLDGTAIAPFADVTIADGHAGATEAVTITLSGAGGTLAGSGLTENADGSYSLDAEDPATITTELQALNFTSVSSVAGNPSRTTFTLKDVSSSGKNATDNTTSVASVRPILPVQITGYPNSQNTSGEAAIAPFAGINILDGNVGAVETVSIFVVAQDGTLTGPGLTRTPYGTDDIYTLEPADSDVVTAELRAITFTPASPTTSNPLTTQIFLSDRSSLYPDIKYASTTISDTPTSSPALALTQDDTTATLNGDATADVTGNRDTVTASGAGGTIHFGGTGESATISDGTVAFWDGAGGTVTGDRNTVTLDDGATATVVGSGNVADLQGAGGLLSIAGSTVNVFEGGSGTVTGDGDTLSIYAANATVTANGAGDAATLYDDGETLTMVGSGATVAIGGTGEALAASGASVELWDDAGATVTGDGDTVKLDNGATATVVGSGNVADLQSTGGRLSIAGSTVNVFEGGSGTVTGDGDTLSIYAANATVTANGAGDAATLYDDGETLTMVGSGATVAIGGTGEALVASGASVELWDDAGATVTGDGDTVKLDNGATATVVGSGNVADLQSAGGRLSIAGSTVNVFEGGSGTVTGDGNTLSIYAANTTVTANGAGDAATLYDDGETLTMVGSGATVAIGGTGEALVASGASVELWDDAGATVTGDGNRLTLDGGATLAASGSNDTFVFSPTPGNVLLTGYDATDTLQFSNSQFSDWQSLLGHASQHGADTVIQTDASHSLTLAGVTLATLDRNHVAFA